MAKKKQQSMKVTKKGKAARKALGTKVSKLPVSKQRLLDDIVDMLRTCDTWIVRQYRDQIYDDQKVAAFSEPTARSLR